MTKRSNHRSPMTGRLTPPGLELVYEVHQPITPMPIDIASSSGHRLLVDIGDVPISGPRIEGKHLPGASLILTVLPNGIARVDGSFGLVTDDGYYIFGRMIGRGSIPPEHALALAVGEPLDPEAYYLRGCVEYEAAGDGPYEWLNRCLCISKVMRSGESSFASVWQIL